MNWIKGFALVTCLAVPMSAVAASSASAETTDSKPMASKPTKAQISAYQEKCSKDADTKGLKGKAKSEERKSFRTECIKKLVNGL